jgi:hypothetical protein
VVLLSNACPINARTHRWTIRAWRGRWDGPGGAHRCANDRQTLSEEPTRLCTIPQPAMFSETMGVLRDRGQKRCPVTLPRAIGGICKCEALKAPHSKCVDGRHDTFCSVPISFDLYWKNRPHVPFRAVQSPPVVPCRGPFWDHFVHWRFATNCLP